MRFKKKLKKEFYEANASLYESNKTDYNRKLKARKKEEGVLSDARAMAQEFGTARNPAKSYLRPALESQAQSTVNILSTILARRIEQFRAKMK